jgi:hypothetical protein
MVESNLYNVVCHMQNLPPILFNGELPFLPMPASENKRDYFDLES